MEKKDPTRPERSAKKNPTMLRRTTATLRPAAEPRKAPGGYFLSEVRLDIPSPDKAVFRARLHGPAGAHVWTRAWLSNEVDGTLAEAASPRLTAGDEVTLAVTFRDDRIPAHAWMRIESSPLATEQVVGIKLPDAKADASPAVRDGSA